jgi:hypothetical protein
MAEKSAIANFFKTPYTYKDLNEGFFHETLNPINQRRLDATKEKANNVLTKYTKIVERIRERLKKKADGEYEPLSEEKLNQELESYLEKYKEAEKLLHLANNNGVGRKGPPRLKDGENDPTAEAEAESPSGSGGGSGGGVSDGKSVPTANGRGATVHQPREGEDHYDWGEVKEFEEPKRKQGKYTKMDETERLSRLADRLNAKRYLISGVGTVSGKDSIGPQREGRVESFDPIATEDTKQQDQNRELRGLSNRLERENDALVDRYARDRHHQALVEKYINLPGNEQRLRAPLGYNVDLANYVTKGMALFTQLGIPEMQFFNALQYPQEYQELLFGAYGKVWNALSPANRALLQEAFSMLGEIGINDLKKQQRKRAAPEAGNGWY